MTPDAIALCVPNIGEAERANLNACIDTGYVSSVGPFVSEFEARIGAAMGVDRAVATGSGTQALHLALYVAGVQRGDLVVMPAFTFIATANACWQAGASPLLLDIEPEGWTLDPEALRGLFEEDCDRTAAGLVHRASGRRIGAVMPVYTLGNVARMREIDALAQAAGVPLVADAAAALGSTYEGGTQAEIADLSCLSFNGNKIVTSGCGGAVFGRQRDWMTRARHVASTARQGADYDHDQPAFNYRMSNTDAAVGCAQMDRLGRFIDVKRQVRAAYNALAASRSYVAGFPEAPWGRSNCWFSGLVFNQQGAGAADVAALRADLAVHGIEARPFWKPVHLQQPYADSPTGRLERTNALWSRVVTLPCSTGITAAELDRCSDVVASALARLEKAGSSSGLPRTE